MSELFFKNYLLIAWPLIMVISLILNKVLT